MPTIVLGAVSIDSETRKVSHPEGTRRLSPTELKLLFYLYKTAPRAVPPEELLQEVWGYSELSRSRTVSMTLRRLRKKVELDPDAPRFLLTVLGQGIQLKRGSGSQSPKKPRGPDHLKQMKGPEFGAEVGTFVGRDRILEQCLDWIKQGRWLTLTGVGGVGKTRLAQVFAQRLHDTQQFSDGVVFLPMVGLDGADAIFPALLTRLGADQSVEKTPLALAIQTIQDLKMALFLDNAEHLDGLVDPLEHLLSSCPGLKIVVTSRRVVGSLMENRLPVGGLESEAASLQLFHSFLGHFSRGRTQPPPDDSKIRPWLKCLAHHPLSLRLSAALCVAHGELANSSHLDLRAVFEHTWKSLGEPLQRDFAKLSLLHKALEEKKAAAGLGISLGALNELEKWGLLEGKPGAFTLHPTIRKLAREKLEGMGGRPGNSGAVSALPWSSQLKQ